MSVILLALIKEAFCASSVVLTVKFILVDRLSDSSSILEKRDENIALAQSGVPSGIDDFHRCARSKRVVAN